MDTLFQAWLLPVACVWMRLFGATLGIPAFRFFRVPRLFFALLLLGLALPIAATPGAQLATALPVDVYSLPVLMLAELATGLLLGFGLNCAFVAVDAFGHLLDAQSGLGIANLLGLANRPQPITAAFFTATAICLFFGADLHHDFLAAVVGWYRLVPAAWLLDQLDDPIHYATLLHRSFAMGILMAMPLAALMLFGDILLAFAGRSMPQLNVLFLSFPIKLLMVLFGLVATAHLIGPVFVRLLTGAVDGM